MFLAVVKGAGDAMGVRVARPRATWSHQLWVTRLGEGLEAGQQRGCPVSHEGGGFLGGHRC